ncbi:hypothetical protein ACWEO2_09775 [Nocardia sp. NPDC004278]
MTKSLMAHHLSVYTPNNRVTCSSALEHGSGSPSASGFHSSDQIGNVPPVVPSPSSDSVVVPRARGRHETTTPTSYSVVKAVYGSVLVNYAGRIAERSVLSCSRWEAETPIHLEPTLPDVVLVTAPSDGGYSIARNGQLPIPAPIRRTMRLRIGHRVLPAAHPDQNRLIIVCQNAFATLLEGIRDQIDGGEQR